jgi:hypothetical protein
MSSTSTPIDTYLYINWVSLFEDIKNKEMKKIQTFLQKNGQSSKIDKYVTLRPTRIAVIPNNEITVDFADEFLKSYTNGYIKFNLPPFALEININISYVLSRKLGYVGSFLKSDVVRSINYHYKTKDLIQSLTSESIKNIESKHEKERLYQYHETILECSNPSENYKTCTEDVDIELEYALSPYPPPQVFMSMYARDSVVVRGFSKGETIKKLSLYTSQDGVSYTNNQSPYSYTIPVNDFVNTYDVTNGEPTQEYRQSEGSSEGKSFLLPEILGNNSDAHVILKTNEGVLFSSEEELINVPINEYSSYNNNKRARISIGLNLLMLMPFPSP